MLEILVSQESSCWEMHLGVAKVQKPANSRDCTWYGIDEGCLVDENRSQGIGCCGWRGLCTAEARWTCEEVERGRERDGTDEWYLYGTNVLWIEEDKQQEQLSAHFHSHTLSKALVFTTSLSGGGCTLNKTWYINNHAAIDLSPSLCLVPHHLEAD